MMRRILFPVVMCLVAFTAFGHASVQTTDISVQCVETQPLSAEATMAIDSLSAMLGDVYGIGMGMQIHSEADADIDVAQVSNIINQMVYCQEGKDFIRGMESGVMIAKMCQGFKAQRGRGINKPLLLEQLKAELLTENPIDESKAIALEDRLNELDMQIESSGEDQIDALIDSISSTAGAWFGFRIRYDNDSQSAVEQTIKGIEYVIEREPQDNYFLAAVQLGIQVVESLDYFQEKSHMPLNKALFMEHLTSGMNVKSIDQGEYHTLSDQIEPLLEKAAGLSPASIANIEAGEAYMEQLRSDSSYTFTKGGIAYKMLKKGKGEKFTEDDVVNTIYVAKHLDGTEFDSSDGEPMPLSTNQVIPGFAEMLQLMKPGGKAIVVIPGNLAYGAMGVGDLGPNETLIFEIETVDRQQ